MDNPTPTKPRGQESMTDFVAAMEKAGLLVRITDEKRVDELPMLMEAALPEGCLRREDPRQ